MNKSSKVTQVMAADMAGVSRATIIRHIKDGKLSKDGDGRIDISELIRVYGNDILTPEQIEARKAEKEEKDESGDSVSFRVEIDFLKKHLETVNLERERERKQLSDQIDMLKERLEKSEEREAKITLLLTHQSKENSEEKSRKEQERDTELKALKVAISRLEENNSRSFWGRLMNRRTGA